MIDFKQMFDDKDAPGVHKIKQSQIFRIKRNDVGEVIVQSKKYSNSAQYGPPLNPLPSVPNPDADPIVKVLPRGRTPQVRTVDGRSSTRDPTANLRKTMGVLDTYEPVGWDDDAKAWWEQHLTTDQEYASRDDTVRVRHEYTHLKPHAATTATDAIPAPDTQMDHHVEVIVFPEPEDISLARPSATAHRRRNGDPNELNVGDLVAMKADGAQRHVANADRAQDIATPFWVGKLLEVNGSQIRVHWYGAEASRGGVEGDDEWLMWRWAPRFNAQRKSQPVSSWCNKYECGLVAYGFTLKQSQPKFGLMKRTVQLIRERLADEATQTELDHLQDAADDGLSSDDDDVPLAVLRARR